MYTLIQTATNTNNVNKYRKKNCKAYLKTTLDLRQKAQKQTYFLKPNCLKQKIGE